MEFNIALLRGDGIGPEIVDSAVTVLEKIGEKYGHKFNFTKYLIGGAAIDETGVPLPKETVEGCQLPRELLELLELGGDFISTMAFIFSGFSSIPRLVTR